MFENDRYVVRYIGHENRQRHRHLRTTATTTTTAERPACFTDTGEVVACAQGYRK